MGGRRAIVDPSRAADSGPRLGTDAMQLLTQINWLYALSGLFVGALVGLTGVGGGALMTPLLVLLFGIHANTAVGPDLLYAAATKTVGTAVHGASGTVDWRIVGRLAAGSVPATILTLFVLARIEKQVGSANHIITLVLGVALIVTAIAILFRRMILDFFAKRAEAPNPRRVT